MKLYKILDNEGHSCHGGDANWNLPTKGADGNWKPGEWMREIEGKLELCVNGYHLVRAKDLLGWLNAAIYEAEYEGEQLTGEDKIVVRKCRLVRKCEGWTEETARLFACWCVRHTPLADGRTTWDLLSDNRSRTAVETAERYAKGEANEGELNAARDAARAAAWPAAGPAAWAAVWAAAWDAAWDAAGAAAWAAAWDAAGAVQTKELLSILEIKEEEKNKKMNEKMNEKKKIEGKVTAWGIRLQVPAPVIKGIGLEVDDEVSWTVEEVGGKKAAILMKKAVK